MKPGDTLQATDGKGTFYDCVITGDKKGICLFDVRSTRSVAKQTYQVHIAIAPTKNHDRLEWFVEKATEIGIHRIIPLQCEHNERKKINDERLQKVAISAMKQSLKAWLPDVRPLTSFKQALAETVDQKFIAHLDDPPAPHLLQSATRDSASLVLIGPEGDFTNDEVLAAIDHGFRKVSLGPHRLRTETAAMVACHTLNLVNQ
jgi:16S rRNA (uracil1498-N3)-methyltransferase